jgi:hypothetical protein
VSLLEAQALGNLANLLSNTPWSHEALLSASRDSRIVNVGRWNREVVEADLALNQAYWRVLALIDPFRFPIGNRDFAHYYPLLKFRLSQEYSIAEDDAREPAIRIARFLAIEVRRHRDEAQRSKLSISMRELLVDAAGGEPRCWYCGMFFPGELVDRFCNGDVESYEGSNQVLFDFTAPRGLEPRHLRIEVDHVHPHTRGGASDESNLRLACGWCNSHKSHFSLLFDTRSVPKVFDHPGLGMLLRPVPFWIVRVLGTNRECEKKDCHASSRTECMVVAPGDARGAMVPGNLAVFCKNHDPLSTDRLVPRSALAT